MRLEAALPVAVAAVVALAGCGSAKDARRSNFNRYVARVNQVEADASRAWARVRLAYVRLAKGVPSAAEVGKLAAAPGTIRDLRRNLEQIDPPADAKPVHRMLLHILALDAALADELAAFGRYIHDVTALEQQLGKATTQLRRSLKTTAARRGQERVLSAYAGQLATLLQQLRALTPPPSMAPWQREQIGRVSTLQTGAQEVQRGLAANDRVAVGEGLGLLQGAVAQSPVTKADRAAIVAYNKRLDRIRRLLGALERRQADIAQSLT
jgi:hypothetical protein